MIDTHHQVADARELAIASAGLLDASFYDAVPEFSANDVRDEFAALIVATTQRQYQAGRKPDLYTVADELDRGGALQEKLGPDAMQRMLALVQSPISSDPVALARQVHQEAQRRRLRLRLESVIAGIDDPTVPVDQLSKQLTGAADLLGNQWSGIESLTSAELDAGEFELSYLIEDVLPADQPAILAAPKKCCKTNCAIDMALSLASGCRMLGKFYVPKAVNVALVSGESGKAVIQETCRRIARSKLWPHLGDYSRATWSFDLPQLSDHRSLMALRQFIRRHHLDCLILDPIYLMLCLGDDAGNLFKVGPILYQLARMAADERVTLLLLHHLVKAVGVTDGPPELESMSWAGFQEFARAWILMSRRAKYNTERPGHHEFWFATGGSAGHSIGKAIDIDEGQRKDQGGRKWVVDVRPIGEAIGEKIEAAETVKATRKAEADQRKRAGEIKRLQEILATQPRGITYTQLRSRAEMSEGRLQNRIDELKAAGTVLEWEIRSANKQKYPGVILASLKPSASSASSAENADDADDTIGIGVTTPPIGGSDAGVCVSASESTTDTADADGKQTRKRLPKPKAGVA